MKHILMTVLLGVAAPLAIAGEGGPVQQVIEAPRQEVGPVIVQLEESIPLIMSDNIAGISIGTSRIADVIVHDQNTLFVTGKAYGSTSLHVIDTLGNVVVDTTIHVVDASTARAAITPWIAPQIVRPRQTLATMLITISRSSLRRATQVSNFGLSRKFHQSTKPGAKQVSLD